MQDTSDEVNDPVEREFVKWYGGQRVTTVGTWYETPNCLILATHDMSQGEREQLARYLLGEVQGEGWGPYAE